MEKSLLMEKSKAEESPWEKKGKKTGPTRKERVPFWQENSFVKATGTGRAPRWRPDFEQRSRCQTKIFHTWWSLLCRLPQRPTERSRSKETCLFPRNLDPSSLEVPLSYWFVVSGGEIIGTLSNENGDGNGDRRLSGKIQIIICAWLAGKCLTFCVRPRSEFDKWIWRWLKTWVFFFAFSAI